jgi:hypothetical protein
MPPAAVAARPAARVVLCCAPRVIVPLRDSTRRAAPRALALVPSAQRGPLGPPPPQRAVGRASKTALRGRRRAGVLAAAPSSMVRARPQQRRARRARRLMTLRSLSVMTNVGASAVARPPSPAVAGT